MREWNASGNFFNSKIFAFMVHYITSPMCVINENLVQRHLLQLDFGNWKGLMDDIADINAFLAVVAKGLFLEWRLRTGKLEGEDSSTATRRIKAEHLSASDVTVVVTRRLFSTTTNNCATVFGIGESMFGFMLGNENSSSPNGPIGDMYITYDTKGAMEIRHKYGMRSFCELCGGRSVLRLQISKDGTKTHFAGEQVGSERKIFVECVDGSKTSYEGPAGHERAVSMVLSPGPDGSSETLDARALRSYHRSWVRAEYNSDDDSE
tara:strand:+ start:1505 stop:2296 length:792 start_codon:yes stop_codon:yes gene_type:complete